MKKYILIVTILVFILSLYGVSRALVGPSNSGYVGPPVVESGSSTTSSVTSSTTSSYKQSANSTEKEDENLENENDKKVEEDNNSSVNENDEDVKETNDNNSIDNHINPVCPPVYQLPKDKAEECIDKGGKMVYKIENGCRVGPPVCVYKFERPEELKITPSGEFLARGMVVKEIDEENNTFTGEVWGSVWKVDVSKASEFLLRSGENASSSVSNVLSQIAVGEELGVLGKVYKERPGVVVAKLIRNYNIIKALKPVYIKNKIKNVVKNKVRKEIEHKKNSYGNESGGNNGILARTIQEKINAILKKIEEIQNQIKAQSQ